MFFSYFNFENQFIRHTELDPRFNNQFDRKKVCGILFLTFHFSVLTTHPFKCVDSMGGNQEQIINTKIFHYSCNE